MKLEYKHHFTPILGTDMVKHKAVLFIRTNFGKCYKFKNVRLLGADIGTSMYAERRQLQDILDSVEAYDNIEISKEEMRYIKDHFDELFFTNVLKFELIKE